MLLGAGRSRTEPRATLINTLNIFCQTPNSLEADQKEPFQQLGGTRGLEQTLVALRTARVLTH